MKTNTLETNQFKQTFHEAVSAHLQGNIRSAIHLYEGLLEISPDHGPSLNNLAAIYLDSGEQEAALKYLKQALSMDAENVDALNNIGILLARSGKPDEALPYYQRAIKKKPHDSEIHTNLGAALKDLGRLKEAEERHRKALELDPSNSKAYNNLALVYQLKGDMASAIDCLNRAIHFEPDDEQLYFNLGEMLVSHGYLEEAVGLSEQLLSKFPGSILSSIGAARVFLECGQWENAEPLIQVAVQHPFSARESGLLRHLLLFINGSSCAPVDIARMHRLSGGLIEELHEKDIKANPFDFTGRFDGLHSLRVGYVSPDFRRHSVGWFFREIIHHHDHERFKIYCYSLTDRSDDLTDEIRTRAFQFQQVGNINDIRIARQIYEDRIQVLVDLAGYTTDNRLDIFALKPAPVQITALGYPHGTGLRAMDYRITSREAERPGAEKEYRERLLWMPDHFLPFPIFERSDGHCSREVLGLPSNAFLMASFNAWHKLRPEVLRLWNHILLEAPNSYLAFSFKYSDKNFARRQVLRHFTVNHDRILFLCQARNEEQHRTRYNMADLALDPFPYSGTTTSWEALSMGVPVITLKGDRHVQRTTWSMLRRLHLTFLCAEDEETYLRLAVDLTRNRERLEEIKRQIRDSMGSLEDANIRYVKDLEAAYLKTWQIYLKTSLAPHFSSQVFPPSADDTGVLIK